MNDDALKTLWQKHAASENEIKLDAEKLLVALNRKLEKLDGTIAKRDRRETLAAYAVTLFFIASAFFIQGVFAKIGAIIIAFSALFIVHKLKKVKNAGASRQKNDVRTVTPSHEPPDLKNWLLQEIEKVEAQISLLRSVWKWYLSPMGVGVLLLINGQINVQFPVKIASSAFVIALYIFIYYLNLRAVKKQLTPLRQELREKLLLLEKRE